MDTYFYTIINEIYDGDNSQNQVEYAEQFFKICVTGKHITVNTKPDAHSYLRNIWAYDLLKDICSNDYFIKCCLNEFYTEFCERLLEHIADKLIWTNEDYLTETPENFDKEQESHSDAHQSDSE